MPTPTPDMVQIMRMFALVIWSIITLWSAPAYRRAALGRAESDDWKQCAMGIVGVAVMSYQTRVLSGFVEGSYDYWTAASTVLLAVAGLIVVLFVHLPRTPDGHKRAMLFSHAGIVFLCVIGGLL